MTLRTFHLVFILCAMVVMDLLGAWGCWNYIQSQTTSFLILGIAGLVSGLALPGYGLFVVRKFDREGIA